MKVILLKEVKTLGKINQVIEVKDGYAKNFLFPQNLAVPATKGTMEKIKEIRAQESEMAIEKVKYFQKVKADIEGINLEFKLRVKNDKVSGAVSTKQITAYLYHNFKIIVDKHKFIGFKPINRIGTTEVAIKLMSDIIAQFKVTVTAIEG